MTREARQRGEQFVQRYIQRLDAGRREIDSHILDHRARIAALYGHDLEETRRRRALGLRLGEGGQRATQDAKDHRRLRNMDRVFHSSPLSKDDYFTHGVQKIAAGKICEIPKLLICLVSAEGIEPSTY